MSGNSGLRTQVSDFRPPIQEDYNKKLSETGTVWIMDDDAIADYLSDTYGFLLEGFSLPMDDDDRDYFGEYVNYAEGKVS